MADTKTAATKAPKGTRKPSVRRVLFYIYPTDQGPGSSQARITWSAEEVLDLAAGGNYTYHRVTADRQVLSPKDSKK